jgi:hypothetical protein
MAGIISLVIGLCSLLFGLFLGQKKGEEAQYKKLTKIGVLTALILPICLIGVSIYSDFDNLNEIAAKERKIMADSVSLANRWLHDTTRLHQIIDRNKG